MPLHVKEKSAWKTVKIPEDVLNGDDFSGLVDIQELTDYELVPFQTEDDQESGGNSSSRSRKRKRQGNAEEAVGSDTLESSGTRKKKRKRKKSCNTEGSGQENGTETVETGSEADDKKNGETDECSKSLKNKKKEKKGKLRRGMINSEIVEIVTGEEELDLDEEHGKAASPEDKAETQSKKGKNKKKKVSGAKEKLMLQSETKTVCDALLYQKNQKEKKEKKKKKKSKLQQSQAVNQAERSAAQGQEEEHSNPIDMTEWEDLFVPEEILQALQDQKFTKPTTIQKLALPSAIRDRKDILGAAETGSGKTLAFGIPLLSHILDTKRWSESVDDDGVSDDEDDHDSTEPGEDVEIMDVGALPKKKSRKNPPMALILEPTRELAVQVRKHLVAVSKHTSIKIANVVGGMSVEKQRRVLGKSPEVVIATPGRLWQLIEEGNEHLCQVDRIRCLVLDEADRMVERGHYEELTKLFELIKKSPRRVKNRQTFVMSATLTMDISAPKRLMNKGKKAPKEEDKIKSLIEKICNDTKPKVIDLTPVDKVAQTLTELRVNCKADEKDFYLYYFLCQHPGRTLVFVNSKDCLRRLINLFTLLQCFPLPLHADMHQRQRLKNLDKFSENSKALLVASDVAARGLDIPGVDHVIHYQVPRTMENYVHRSGRTARASNQGLSVMLVGPEDAKDYRKIIYGVRNGEELPLLPVELDLLPTVKSRVLLAREVDVTEYRTKKKKVKNNFFIKAAEEMDMIIDDPRLLEDLGDSVEQAESRQRLSQMKARLARELKGPLTPLHMTKYPTKSGQLAVKTVVDLYSRR